MVRQEIQYALLKARGDANTEIDTSPSLDYPQHLMAILQTSVQWIPAGWINDKCYKEVGFGIEVNLGMEAHIETTMFEIGHQESYDELLQEAKMWLEGEQQHRRTNINTVVLIKIDEGPVTDPQTLWPPGMDIFYGR